MLLVNKRADLAENMYNKLRACAHTAKDAIIKMFAYKQLGYTYIQLERYESAVMSFKYMLALSWAVRSTEGEYAAYEGLQRAYLYQGLIDKVKFYNKRAAEGDYESPETQLFKLSVSFSLNENTWLKNEQ